MAPLAQHLDRAQIDAIATYLTGSPPTHDEVAAIDPAAAATCPASSPPGTDGPAWNGWSPTPDNARFATDGGIAASDVARLQVKWAFRFTGGVGGQPTVVGGRIYLGTGSGAVYSLDAASGCVHWQAQIDGAVRAAVSVGSLSADDGRLAVFAGDRSGGVHAFDAASGEAIWSTKVDDHQFATVTGSPILHGDRLFVPMSSTEEISPFVPGYKCCTFRGSVSALDPATGEILWKSYTIAEEPRAFGTTDDGVERIGPAGAAVWSAPTIDPGRGLLYVATGDSYTDAPNIGSDAIVAMDLVTGDVRWTRQITANDNYLVGCTGEEGQPAACPDEVGPDHDFGASPILVDLPDGSSVLLAGQKSGEVTALDPDRDGEVLWRAKPGLGGPLGGIEWGMAADGSHVYVPIADPFPVNGVPKPGMYALNIADGSEAWSSPAPAADCSVAPRGSLVDICTNGLSAAATAIDGVAFAGSMDGILRAYSADTGEILWSIDLGQTSFQPLNSAEPLNGDTMNAAGATIVDGTLFQISGYKSSNPQAVNLLLAFTVDGE
jgi:polyvinyl alcohol dehydrogenase (cytochrome)